MKKLYSTLIGICLSFFIYAQGPSFQWAKSIGGISNDIIYATAVDHVGNVVTTGWFWYTVDFDPGPSTSTLTSVGNQDIFISKLDAAGNYLWAKSIGGSAQDLGKGITTDAAGNVYVTGYFYGTADFDPGPGVSNLTSAVNEDIFILKLDAAGNFVWAKQFAGGQFQIIGNSIVVDALSNVYITGSFDGIVDFNTGPATNTISTAGGNDIFVAKLDPSGNYLWAKSMGSTGFDRGESIIVDSLGYAYTTGFFSGAVDFNPGAGVATLTASSTSEDIFISKLDPAGNYVWAKSIGNTGVDHGTGIALDTMGNLYTTGFFESVVDFSSGIATGSLTSAGSQDAFVLKLDTAGNFKWVKGIGGSSQENGYAITVDDSGNAYTTGGYSGITDFDPSPTSILTYTSLGYQDIYISKLDSVGNFVWVQTMGQIVPDVGNSIALGPNRSIYTAGTYYFTVDFDPGPGTATLTSIGGNSDGFIQKMIQCNGPSVPINVTPSGNLTLCQNQNVNLSVSSSDIVTWYATSTSTAVLSTGLSFTTSALSSGVVTFYAAATNTCTTSNRIPITITVNPSPTLTVNSGSICSGNTFTLIPGGANSYTYSSGSSIVTPTISSTYSITGTSSFGCVGTNTAVSNVTVNPLPTLTVTSSDSLICVGELVILSVTGASTYTWNTSSTTSTISVTPSVTTTFTVNGILNGCSDSATITQSVNLCTGTHNLNSNSLEIFVHPNPTNGSLTINSKTELQKIEVLSITGQVLLSEIPTTISHTLHLDNFSNGIYFVNVYQNDRVVKREKIVLNK